MSLWCRCPLPLHRTHLAPCSARSQKYATKAEKGSKRFEKALGDACRKFEDLDDMAGAETIFASMLKQQTGGRDWTAQEVCHAVAGIPTVVSSHTFNSASLARSASLKPNLNRNTPDDLKAVVETNFGKYLNRLAADNLTLQTLFGSAGGIGRHSISRSEVVLSSFTDFWSQFEVESAGRGKKGAFTIKRRAAPTVTLVKPRMPKFFGARGHAKRAEYCRIQLMSHKPFDGREHFNTYMAQHAYDWEAGAPI